MSVARCREINARLRAAGVTVHEWAGCWTRGNGLSPAYEGGIVHHTASGFGKALPGTGIGGVLVDGRSDLSGPLCNWAGNDDGSLTFIAAFPANHAGASGGSSMGPLPVTRLFNPRVMGLEIVYPGTVPMRDAQYRSALIWARIVADVVGYANIQRLRAHAETSVTGKTDPADAPGRTINMPAFRTAATVIRTPPQENDMQPTDAVKDPGPNRWGHTWLNTNQVVNNKDHGLPSLAKRLDAQDKRLAAIEAALTALATKEK
jgi:hypothetical protein